MPPRALLYDIHGNLPALDAVLEDALTVGVGHFVLGGDYALFGAWPEQTVEGLRALQRAEWIRGNGERWTASADQAPDDEVVQGAIEACRDALGAKLVAELAFLPEQTVIGDTRYCHASPVSDVRSFMPAPAEDEAELLERVSERRLVFGHTHVPFRRTSTINRDGRVVTIELVNPGSVGMPFDGDPRAAYAILHDDAEERIEHRRVAYDHERSARAVRDHFDHAPWTDTIARRIATARP
jgi:diadenosine tetraphosphatase ApaH/serine/threonine PP2A family protein phosphatase